MTCYLYVTGIPLQLRPMLGATLHQRARPGKYNIEIWHETLGRAKASVTIAEDGTSEAVEVKMSEKKKGGGRRRRR